MAVGRPRGSWVGLTRRELSPRILARFHRRYTRLSDDACWEWTGARFAHGYGMVNLGRCADGRQHTAYAHRVAFVLAYGDIPTGPGSVMHGCDNRACVNPAHLSFGTQRDNLGDASRKGRLARTFRKAA